MIPCEATEVATEDYMVDLAEYVAARKNHGVFIVKGYASEGDPSVLNDQYAKNRLEQGRNVIKNAGGKIVDDQYLDIICGPGLQRGIFVIFISKKVENDEIAELKAKLRAFQESEEGAFALATSIGRRVGELENQFDTLENRFENHLDYPQPKKKGKSFWSKWWWIPPVAILATVGTILLTKDKGDKEITFGDGRAR